MTRRALSDHRWPRLRRELARRASTQQRRRVVQIDQEVEITDPGALLAAVTDAAPDAIYHLAAMTHVGQSWDEPLRVLEVNVLGTGALLAAARECGTDPRVLVTSSAEVYGAVTDPSRLPLTEDRRRPRSPPMRHQSWRPRRCASRPGLVTAARGGGPSVQPHRARASPPTSRSRPSPSGSSTRSAPVPPRSRSETSPPAATSPTSGTWCAPTGCCSSPARPGRSTTCARAWTSRSRRSPTGCWPTAGSSVRLVSDPSLLRPVEVPVLRGDPGRLKRPPAGPPRSRWTRPWPTCWPTGGPPPPDPTPGIRTRRTARTERAVRTATGGIRSLSTGA